MGEGTFEVKGHYMHESMFILGKSIALGIGVTAAATLGRLPALFGQETEIAEIGAWGKIVAEYGVLVGLAIYFLWRDWKREKTAEDKAREVLKLSHEREMKAIEATKERDSAQFRSRDAQAQAANERWMHSENKQAAMQLKMFVIIEHFMRQRDKPKSITDTDKFEPQKPE